LNNTNRSAESALPLILCAAVIQGWALYLLQLSITHHRWPSTDLGWLFALYAVFVFIPVAVQLLAIHGAMSETCPKQALGACQTSSETSRRENSLRSREHGMI
jgi:hypothetical protein